MMVDQVMMVVMVLAVDLVQTVVVALRLFDGSKGYAIVEGNDANEVDFEYRGGNMSGLTCFYFCTGNCKHEFAAMLQLRETLGLIEKNYSDEYERTGYFTAITKGVLFNFAIDDKEKGGFVL